MDAIYRLTALVHSKLLYTCTERACKANNKGLMVEEYSKSITLCSHVNWPHLYNSCSWSADSHKMAILYHYRQQRLYLTPNQVMKEFIFEAFLWQMLHQVALLHAHVFSRAVLWFREQSGVNWTVLVHHGPTLLLLQPETFWCWSEITELSLIIQFKRNY